MTTPLRCIVDASVGIKQFIPDPLIPKVNQLFAHLSNPQTQIFVPDLFYIECGNIRESKIVHKSSIRHFNKSDLSQKRR